MIYLIITVQKTFFLVKNNKVNSETKIEILNTPKVKQKIIKFRAF